MGSDSYEKPNTALAFLRSRTKIEKSILGVIALVLVRLIVGRCKPVPGAERRSGRRLRRCVHRRSATPLSTARCSLMTPRTYL